jgi:hypothetical protein
MRVLASGRHRIHCRACCNSLVRYGFRVERGLQPPRRNGREGESLRSTCQRKAYALGETW